MKSTGECLGACACGCGEPVFETIYYNKDRQVDQRTRPKFVRGHNIRKVHHHYPTIEESRAAIKYATAARMAGRLPYAQEIHALIQQRRRERGMSTKELAGLLGWKYRRALHSYVDRTYIERSTLNRILDVLYANEGGWVEAEGIWKLIDRKKEWWGMNEEQMSSHLVTGPLGISREKTWMGKVTAEYLLKRLMDPHVPTEFEKEYTNRRYFGLAKKVA